MRWLGFVHGAATVKGGAATLVAVVAVSLTTGVPVSGAAVVAPASSSGWTRPPAEVVLPTGQPIHPAGRVVALRAFPTGAAVSPDGSIIVAIAGNPATVNTVGLPLMAVEVIDASTGAIRQTFTVVDAFQSVTFDAAGRNVYVAGGGAHVVYDFAVTAGGLLQPPRSLAVPGCQFTSGFALTPGQGSLWAACPNDGVVVSLALPSGQPTARVLVPSPDQVAVSPDGATVYATNWRGTTVAAVNVYTLTATTITVGDHPEALIVLPDGRVVVTDANDATVATISPVTHQVALTRVGMIGPGTDSPNGIAAGPNGALYVTLGADNAVAVLIPTNSDTPTSRGSNNDTATNSDTATNPDTPTGEKDNRAAPATVSDSNNSPGKPSTKGPWKVAGYLSTGWYPTGLAVAPGGRRLDVVTARGLGHSAAATAPYLEPDPARLAVDGAYLTVGALEQINVPDPGGLQVATAVVRHDNAAWTPHDAPRVLTSGASGPIKHVIYITRENKLYDTELGDLHPGPGTALTVFGQTVTPNLHALARTWVDAQSFYEPTFRSTLGHMWEDAGGPSDLYERAANENYLSASWSDPTAYPAGGLLVTQAWKAGRTVRTYNEETAQASGLLPNAYQAPTSVFPNYDLHYPDSSRELGWDTEFRQFEAHHCTGVLASSYGANCQLPSLEYVYLGEDHTTVIDKPGYPTVQAQVADNDYATARIIDAVSHSPDWASTLVVVVEDDPQGTGDHISAYRGLIGLASPWVKRGYTTTVHYQWSSVVAAIDRILGLAPLTNYAATARPLDDIFTNKPNFTPFVADPSGTKLYPFIPLPDTPAPLPLPGP